MSYTRDKIANALATGQRFQYRKASQNNEGSGVWHSMWKATGAPNAGANPGSLAGIIPDRTTAGGFLQTNAASGVLFMLKAIVSGTIPETLTIYDRLWTNSTMNTTTTADTSFVATTDVPTARSTWDDNEMWVEIYTAPGATGSTSTVKYTNSGGTTGQAATQVWPVTGGAGAPAVGMMYPYDLQGTDRGVKRPTSYSFSPSTGTAGDVGVTVLKRLLTVEVDDNGKGRTYDWAQLGLPPVPADACLAMMFQSNTTTTGVIAGEIIIGEMVA